MSAQLQTVMHRDGLEEVRASGFGRKLVIRDRDGIAVAVVSRPEPQQLHVTVLQQKRGPFTAEASE